MNDEQNYNAANDDVFVADADEFDDNLDAELPAWPKVVGILSIVWGSLTVLCSGWNVVNVMLLTGMNRQNMEMQFQDGYPPELADPGALQQFLAVFGLLLSALLLVSGIMLVLRKAQARMMFIAYSLLSLLTAVLSMWMVFDLQSISAQWINDNPGTAFADAGDIVLVAMMVGAAIGILLTSIWPLFCLIWFGFVKRTHHDMTGGVDIDTI